MFNSLACRFEWGVRTALPWNIGKGQWAGCYFAVRSQQGDSLTEGSWYIWKSVLQVPERVDSAVGGPVGRSEDEVFKAPMCLVSEDGWEGMFVILYSQVNGVQSSSRENQSFRWLFF